VYVLKETTRSFHDYASSINANVFKSDNVKLENLSVQTPDKTKTLVQNLQLAVPQGDSIVVTGPSGCGKSSLLRVIGGIWSADGRISRPLKIGSQGVLFLPQNNYTTIGTLRDQLIYPHCDPMLGGGNNDQMLLDLLSLVELSYLATQWGLDTTVLWDDCLSGGEAQRLGFARLFYHSPAYAIMDEATSALDDKLQARMLQTCLDKSITLISVAHRPKVFPFHKKMLRLHGAGKGFTVTEIDPLQ